MLSTQSDDAITLHYQPLAECRGNVVSFEALMRWHHQERGPISPEAFIPIFEQSGQIVPLSRWALRQACLDAASWRKPLGVSFNLSAVQFQQAGLTNLVASILAETELEPARLELEVAEAALLTDARRTLGTLMDLSAMGICISLDDFGMGKSSPACLQKFPFSRVKIDRCFVSSIEISVAAKSIIHMIIEFAHSLDLSVVAKGVETEGQLTFLKDEGCDLIQGFLIGRPADVMSFAALTGLPPSHPHLVPWSAPGLTSNPVETQDAKA